MKSRHRTKASWSSRAARQSSQPVTACGQERGAGGQTSSFNQLMTELAPSSTASSSNTALQEGKRGSFTQDSHGNGNHLLVLQADPTQEAPKQKMEGSGHPPGRRDALTPRCSAVLPLLSAASAVEPFSSRRWTQSTWPFMIASISGVLHGVGGEAAVGRVGLAISWAAALPSPAPPPPHDTSPEKPRPHSLAVDVHDVGDVRPLPAVYQEVQGIGVPVGSWGRRARRGVTHTHTRAHGWVPSSQPPPQTKGTGSCSAARHTWPSELVMRLLSYSTDQHVHRLSWKHVRAQAAGVLPPTRCWAAWTLGCCRRIAAPAPSIAPRRSPARQPGKGAPPAPPGSGHAPSPPPAPSALRHLRRGEGSTSSSSPSPGRRRRGW